ncbi:MAG: hypothetical protein QXV60_00450 [Nitrososphaerota archaeon]
MEFFTPLFYPTFQERIIKVTYKENTFTTLTITWNAVNGAVGYHVYGSPSPFTKNKLTVDPITDLSYDYVVPHAPEDIVWHFWVSWVDGSGTETFIDTEPATVFTNVDPFKNTPQTTDYGNNTMPDVMMYFYRDEIRRRAKTVLENDGEDFSVYLRRWSGKPCIKQDERVSSDPDYESAHFCKYCFGTGILGGYWFSFDIKMRYGEMPPRVIAYTKQGIQFSEDFNSWTLWLPKLHEHDLVVRRSTGQYFVIKDIKESSWRGQPLRQALRLLCLQPGDIRQLVTNENITAALQAANLPFEKPSIWG